MSVIRIYTCTRGEDEKRVVSEILTRQYGDRNNNDVKTLDRFFFFLTNIRTRIRCVTIFSGKKIPNTKTTILQGATKNIDFFFKIK